MSGGTTLINRKIPRLTSLIINADKTLHFSYRSSGPGSVGICQRLAPSASSLRLLQNLLSPIIAHLFGSRHEIIRILTEISGAVKAGQIF